MLRYVKMGWKWSGNGMGMANGIGMNGNGMDRSGGKLCEAKVHPDISTVQRLTTAHNSTPSVSPSKTVHGRGAKTLVI